jgi:hypothetical protein
MRPTQHHPASIVRLWVVAGLLLGGIGVQAPALGAEGIPVGKWVFSPSLETLWQDESNLFLTSDNQTPATSYVLRPHFDWTLPFRESRFRAHYAPQVRKFVDREEAAQAGGEGLEDQYSSHFIEVDLDLNFSNQVSVKVHDEYVIDTLETTRFDAGQEVTFNNDEYRRNMGEIEVLIPLGTKHVVGARVMTEDLSFEETEEPIFLDHSHTRGALLHEIRLTPLWGLRTSLHLGQGVQGRPPTAVFDEEEKFSSSEARLTLRGPLGLKGALEARLGYLKWDFSNPALADYSGLTGELRYRLHLSDRARLTFTATQVALPSFFNINSHYLTRVFETRWVREGEGKLFYLVSAAYRTNEYPVPFTDETTGAVIGPRRKDNMWRAEGGVGYKFNDLLKVEGRFRREERSSNFEELGYDSDRLIVAVIWGWV